MDIPLVRLYAEDATNNFLPAIGPLAVFRPPKQIRLDTGVREGDVTPHYDQCSRRRIRTDTEKHCNECACLDEFVVLGTTTNMTS